MGGRRDNGLLPRRLPPLFVSTMAGPSRPEPRNRAKHVAQGVVALLRTGKARLPMDVASR